MKRKTIVSQFCILSLCWETPSMLGVSICSSALAFSNGLNESWKLARNEILGLLRHFLITCPALSMHMAFSIPKYIWELLKVLIPPTIFPIFFFPRFFSLSIACPDCCSFSQGAPVKTFVFKCFWQKPLSEPWKCSESGERKAGPYTSPWGSH